MEAFVIDNAQAGTSRTFAVDAHPEGGVRAVFEILADGRLDKQAGVAQGSDARYVAAQLLKLAPAGSVVRPTSRGDAGAVMLEARIAEKRAAQ